MVRAANGAAGTEDELADLQRRFHLLGESNFDLKARTVDVVRAE